MSTPPVLRWRLPFAPVDGSGRPVVCPVCGVGEGLVLGMDLDDHSDEPSYVTCPAGHEWLDGRLTRRYGAQLLAAVFESEPGLFAHLDELRRTFGEG